MHHLLILWHVLWGLFCYFSLQHCYILYLFYTHTVSFVEQYLAVSILFGIVKSLKFANFVNITIEIAPNTILAVNLYSIQSVVHGLGCLVAPYMAGKTTNFYNIPYWYKIFAGHKGHCFTISDNAKI